MHDYPVRYDRFVSFVSDESITVSRRYNLEGKVILENVTIKCGHPHELRHEVLAPKPLRHYKDFHLRRAKLVICNVCDYQVCIHLAYSGSIA